MNSFVFGCWIRNEICDGGNKILYWILLVEWKIWSCINGLLDFYDSEVVMSNEMVNMWIIFVVDVLDSIFFSWL